jgi:hypothetical protein
VDWNAVKIIVKVRLRKMMVFFTSVFSNRSLGGCLAGYTLKVASASGETVGENRGEVWVNRGENAL